MPKKKPHFRGTGPPPIGFEWDEGKAAYNDWKHGVSFTEAANAFDDPHSITKCDEQHSVEEDRWLLIGTSARERLLVVLHAEGRGDNIRIIGARDAEPPERRTYEEGEEDVQ